MLLHQVHSFFPIKQNLEGLGTTKTKQTTKAFFQISDFLITSYNLSIFQQSINYKSSIMGIKQTLFISLATLVLFSLFYNIDYQESTQPLKCLARSVMISRGQDWVDKHVPYNGSGTHDGYRTDCSGFVSMCWELAKPGLDTRTFHLSSHNITKNELLGGDAIIHEGEHVVLFASWTNTTHSHYVAMQETNPKTGTIKSVIPYPYWYNTTLFHPIRYNNVC